MPKHVPESPCGLSLAEARLKVEELLPTVVGPHKVPLNPRQMVERSLQAATLRRQMVGQKANSYTN